MYVDPDYLEPDLDEVYRLVEVHPFATLVTDVPELRIAHVPVQVRRDADGVRELVAHVAGADPFAESVRSGARLLVSVVGPAVYVSPSWYADRGLPTYNFVAIEIRGTCVPMDDPDAVRAHLMRLTADHERARKPGNGDREAGNGDHEQAREGGRWVPDGWARERITELLPELQAFTVRIDKVTAKLKLSQNRTPGDRLGVLAALDASPSSADRQVHDLMHVRFDAAGHPRDDAGR
ncbi:FMN-binding negative transcriptional regulator [Kribbella solani]|uniref:FMN-binding negative transcriptional regulator n=1 Tax=Kribbella solani TaxID=236067 RepID=UPI0029BB5E64|nr:FMN-binding negative transcriptional regulator [Kribbella solani]MDX2968099.1 FMN-binding negative transcriptional regulator [Kribbella solani]MDX3004887.1 FMN-binding negative transcriptional regulator [Kribbella solani]